MTRTYNFIFSLNKNFDPQVIRCLNVFLIYTYENNAIKKLDHEDFIGIMLKVLFIPIIQGTELLPIFDINQILYD
jgi:hypothetical protein